MRRLPELLLPIVSALVLLPPWKAAAQTEAPPTPVTLPPHVTVECNLVVPGATQAPPAVTPSPAPSPAEPAPPAPAELAPAPAPAPAEAEPAPVVKVVPVDPVPAQPPVIVIQLYEGPPEARSVDRDDVLREPTAPRLAEFTALHRRSQRFGVLVGLGYATWLGGLSAALSSCYDDYDDYYGDGSDACAGGWSAFGVGLAAQTFFTMGLAVSSLRTAKWLQHQGVRVSRWRAALAIPLSLMPYTAWLATIFGARQTRLNRRAMETWREQLPDGQPYAAR